MLFQDNEWKEVIYMHDEDNLEGRVCGARLSKSSYGKIFVEVRHAIGG